MENDSDYEGTSGSMIADDEENSDSEQQTSSGAQKRPRTAASSTSTKKYTGAATYKSKFQPSWHKKWPCIKARRDNPHAFECTVCLRTMNCGHQGEKDVSRHIASVQHQRNAKGMKNTTTLSFPSSSARDKVYHNLLSYILLL